MAHPKPFIEADAQAPLSKRDTILAAAREVFLEGGYANASMDAVAARANVSKATIYAHFENKRALFEAVIAGRCATAFGAMEVPEKYTDARQALTETARSFIDLIFAPEALAIYRVIIGETTRIPEVGEAFYAAGPVRMLHLMKNFLDDLTRRGLLSIPEAESAMVGDLFLSMLKGDHHCRALLGLPVSVDELSCLTESAVTFVLVRYGVSGR